MIRPDFIFSYWIFVWYLLYISKIVIYNPKIFLFLGVIEGMIVFCILLTKIPLSSVIKYFIVISVIKFIPYFTIRNRVIHYNDIVFSLFLFVIYHIWLFVNEKNMIGIYQNLYNSFVHNKQDTPGYMLVNRVMKFFE